MVDDDVYMLKSNKLPVGESLNDETSYAAFRNKRNSNENTTRYEDEQWRMRRDFHNSFGWSYGLSMFQPYPFGYYPNCHGVSSYFYPYSYNPCNPYFAYDPFGSPFGYSPYYNSYGYNPYGYNPYGYGNSNYGNNYNPTPTVLTNHHTGPRGTIGGFGNPSGRLEGNTLKSMSPGGSFGKPAQNNLVGQRKVDNSVVIGQNITTPSKVVSRPTSTQETRTIRYTPTNDRVTRPVGTTPSNPNMRGGNGTTVPNSGRTIEIRNERTTPSINNGGGSRGNSGGSGSSGGGSGRSGGGSTSNGGRRN